MKRAVIKFLDEDMTRCRVVAVWRGGDPRDMDGHLSKPICAVVDRYSAAWIPNAQVERWKQNPSLTFCFDGETVLPYHDLG